MRQPEPWAAPPAQPVSRTLLQRVRTTITGGSPVTNEQTSYRPITFTIPGGSAQLYSPPQDYIPDLREMDAPPTNAVNTQGLYADLLPVEFKGNKKNITTRLDQFPGPIGGLEYREYDSNLFMFADGWHAWNKVAGVLWNGAPNKIDLVDHVQGADRTTLESAVEWVVNGQAQTSSEISTALKPPPDSCRPYYVKMVPKGGRAAIDRLIITLVPPETKIEFDAWHAAESMVLVHF